MDIPVNQIFSLYKWGFPGHSLDGVVNRIGLIFFKKAANLLTAESEKWPYIIAPLILY